MKKFGKLAICFFMMMLMVAVAVPTLAFASQTETEQTEQNQDDASSAKTDSDSLTTDAFQVRIVPGLNGYYKAGASVPVTVYLESLKQDFEGTVRIIVPGSDYDSEAIAYEKDVMLTAGTQKTISMSVKNASSMGSLKLELENASGKVVLEYEVALKNQSNENVLVGILSDDFTALNYFDGKKLNFSDYSTSSQVVELSAQMLPDEASGLDALGYLIINSYDTSALSDAQCQAIENWVQNGGVLILGTGSDYRQTLSGFQDGFIGGSIGDFQSGELDLGMGGATVSFGKSDGIVELSMAGGTTLDGVLMDENLIWTQTYGQGHVVMTACNLGMEPVSSWSEKGTFAQQLLMASASGYSVERIESINYGNYTDSWSISNAVDDLHEVAEPNMNLLIGLFVVFVILAGPGLYLILKALDRREWMWILVPVLAVVVTGGVFLFSRDMRITAPQEASVTVVSYDSKKDAVSGKVYMGIQVPGATSEQLTLDGRCSNLQTAYNYSSYSWVDSYTASEDVYAYTSAIRELTDGYLLTIRNQSTFESTYLTADCAMDSNETDGLQTDMVKSISGIRGTVTNTTDYDMYGVTVVTSANIVRIGELKAGESYTFDESENEMFRSGYDSIYNYYYGSGYDMTKEEQQLQNQIANACYLLENNYLDFSDSADTYTLAYVPDWEADYVEEPAVKEVNRAILLRCDQIPYEDYPDAQVTTLFQHSIGSYDNWDTDGWMYDSEVEVTFDISSVMNDVYAFVRAEDDASYWGSSEHVTVYGYNLETGEYDELFTDGLYMQFPEGCPYIDAYGIIQMKFTTTLVDETDYAPEITVIGGVR
jgi:hypothetical protein